MTANQANVDVVTVINHEGEDQLHGEGTATPEATGIDNNGDREDQIYENRDTILVVVMSVLCMVVVVAFGLFLNWLKRK